MCPFWCFFNGICVCMLISFNAYNRWTLETFLEGSDVYVNVFSVLRIIPSVTMISPFDFLLAIYGVACVELAHSNLGDWKAIFIIHLIIIIKSEVSIFPIVVIFSMVVCLRWLYYHILSSITYISREHWDFVSTICVQSIDAQSMVFANDRSDTLWPAGRVRLFADYAISLSSLCRLIWRHRTNKMLVRYILPGVCLRLRLFSQLSLIYGVVCLQLTPFTCHDCENVYFILSSSSNRKYESLTIV